MRDGAANGPRGGAVGAWNVVERGRGGLGGGREKGGGGEEGSKTCQGSERGGGESCLIRASRYKSKGREGDSARDVVIREIRKLQSCRHI